MYSRPSGLEKIYSGCRQPAQNTVLDSANGLLADKWCTGAGEPRNLSSKSQAQQVPVEQAIDMQL